MSAARTVLSGALALALALPAGGDDLTVVRVEARMFEYRPAEIKLKKGVPVVLELVSRDRKHGFNVPALKLRADVTPKAPVRVMLTPDKAGRFPFHCDVFCGSGHEGMTGVIVVEDD